MKANRLEKDKETKKMSRHLEEKQQKTASEDKQRIAMLVKRVKELESKAGKGTVRINLDIQLVLTITGVL